MTTTSTTPMTPQQKLAGVERSMGELQDVLQNHLDGTSRLSDVEVDQLVGRMLPLQANIIQLVQAEALLGIASLLEDIRDSIQRQAQAADR